jgi:uncharacterized protein YxjI
MGSGSRRVDRGEERREFGVGGSAYRYQMRQRVLSSGDDYWLENADGDRVFRIDGRALRLRETLELEDAHGRLLCRIRRQVTDVRDTMAIERPDGDAMATVHQELVAPPREKWVVAVENGDDLHVHGSLVDHEYAFRVDGRKVAEVSKRWFRVRDTFGVQIAPDVDALLVLAASVALDAMSHPGE